MLTILYDAEPDQPIAIFGTTDPFPAIGTLATVYINAIHYGYDEQDRTVYAASIAVSHIQFPV